MAGQPRVSIVTVCLNSAATIELTLASVRLQSYPDIEHIVIDGGSTDGTQALVARDGERVSRFVSEPDRGIYDAMNKGIGLASGDVVGFLNADDVFAATESVARIVAAFEADVDACYGDVVYVSETDPTRVIRYWRAGEYRRGLCASGWAPPHPSLYVRRKVLERIGGFDPELRVASDFEFALRLLDVHGASVRYIPEVLARMRAGGVSNRSLKGVLRGHRDMAAGLRRHGYPAGWIWSLRRLARRVPQLLSRPD